LADNRSDQRPEQGGDQGGGERPDGRISSQEAARRAMDFLGEIAGAPPEMVTAVVPADDGWHVDVEMLELARIPDSSDILGCYEVTLDRAGEPVSYRRTRRYVRTQTGEE